MRGRGILHRIINLVIFIVLEIAMLHLVTNNADLQRIWVARGSHAFMGTVWGASESVRNYFTLSAENKKLAQENDKPRSRAPPPLRKIPFSTMSE